MRFLTFDDLYKVCKENGIKHFNANDKPIIVQSIETFEIDGTEKDGLLPVKLKACHIGRNRNQSFIGEDTMKACMGSFKGRPILGAIHQTDTGEFEFHGHDMTWDENGEVEYIEQTVGVISEIAEPYLEYDETTDKTYTIVVGNIFEDYTRAAEILKRHQTCKCSVELAVNEMSWSKDEECLSIDDFTFRAVTILGYEEDGVTEIQEGMEGSNITIEDFSNEKNSIFSTNAQMIEILKQLNETISTFNNKLNYKEGDVETVNHFEELLAKYNVVAEDITFDYESMSDEELDKAFDEAFGEDDTSTEDNGTEPVAEETTTEDEPVVLENSFVKNEDGGATLTYQLSHDDIRTGLYELLYAEDSNAWPWIISVYDDHFIYATNKYYSRKYVKDDNNIALDNTVTEVFNEWITAEERDALKELKANYEELKAFKEDFDAKQIVAQKNDIVNDNKYDVVRENESFKALVQDLNKYSVEEIQTRANDIFDIVSKQYAAYSTAPQTSIMSTNLQETENTTKTKKPYGNLFD